MTEEPGNNDLQLTRGDFLKLAATGAATVALLEACGPGQERGRWKRDRFFENVEYFDLDLEQEIKQGMLDFATNYKDVFDQNLEGQFDQEKWNEDVENSLSMLRRVSNVYQSLKTEGQLSGLARHLLERDFYDAGSVLWATLLVGEKFKDDKEGFSDKLKNPNYNVVAGYPDPFLGQDVFSIQSRWIDDMRNVGGIGESRFMSELHIGNLDRLTRNSWWQKVKGPQGLKDYQQDPSDPMRPEPMRISSGNPDLDNKIRQILQEARLDRVASDLRVVNEDFDWSGNYRSTSSDVDARDIELRIKAALTPEEIQKYSWLLRDLVVHEAGHGMWELMPCIEDDVTVFKHRLEVEKVLNQFRPYVNLERFFQPEGDYIFKDSTNNKQKLEAANERDGLLNMATVTAYTTHRYVGDDLGEVAGLMNFAVEYLEVMDRMTGKICLFIGQ